MDHKLFSLVLFITTISFLCLAYEPMNFKILHVPEEAFVINKTIEHIG